MEGMLFVVFFSVNLRSVMPRRVTAFPGSNDVHGAKEVAIPAVFCSVVPVWRVLKATKAETPLLISITMRDMGTEACFVQSCTKA